MEQASPAVLDDEAVDDDDDFAPSSPGTTPTVPTFLLPPERVIITQPTPETEFSPHQGAVLYMHLLLRVLVSRVFAVITCFYKYHNI